MTLFHRLLKKGSHSVISFQTMKMKSVCPEEPCIIMLTNAYLTQEILICREKFVIVSVKLNEPKPSRISIPSTAFTAAVIPFWEYPISENPMLVILFRRHFINFIDGFKNFSVCTSWVASLDISMLFKFRNHTADTAFAFFKLRSLELPY